MVRRRVANSCQWYNAQKIRSKKRSAYETRGPRHLAVAYRDSWRCDTISRQCLWVMWLELGGEVY